MSSGDNVVRGVARGVVRGAQRGNRSRRSGFTLLEVVTALAVMSLVAIAAIAAVGAQVHVAAHAREIAQAQSLATQRLALLRVLTSGDVQSLPDSIAHGQFVPPNNAYSWRIESTPVLGEDNLNDIRIDVAWDGGAYTLRTRLYAPPAGDPQT